MYLQSKSYSFSSHSLSPSSSIVTHKTSHKLHTLTLKWRVERKGLTIKQVNWMKQFSIFNDYWFFLLLLTHNSQTNKQKQQKNTNDDDADGVVFICLLCRRLIFSHFWILSLKSIQNIETGHIYDTLTVKHVYIYRISTFSINENFHQNVQKIH